MLFNVAYYYHWERSFQRLQYHIIQSIISHYFGIQQSLLSYLQFPDAKILLNDIYQRVDFSWKNNDTVTIKKSKKWYKKQRKTDCTWEHLHPITSATFSYVSAQLHLFLKKANLVAVAHALVLPRLSNYNAHYISLPSKSGTLVNTKVAVGILTGTSLSPRHNKIK